MPELTADRDTSGVAPSRTVVAAFDFDGTLTVRSQLEPFVLQVGGARRTSAAVVRNLHRVVQLPRSSAHRDAAKGAILKRIFGGMSVDTYTALGRTFALHVLDTKMRPDVLARLRWHQECGHQTVIVSASLTAYLEPIAERLGMNGVLCTTLETENGKLTGRMHGANVRGREKVRRLEEWLLTTLHTTEVTLWAYGDTEGDRALLERADHPTWITKELLPAAG